MGTSPSASWGTVQSTSVMNIISAVFLVALSAVEPLSAATTGRPGYGHMGTCKAEQNDIWLNPCVIIENYCNLGYQPSAPYNHICNCTCVHGYEKPVEVCCDTKTVGDYNYTKVDWGSGNLPSNCMNDCIYTRDDKAGSKYCFAMGDQEVTCHDEGEGGTGDAEAKIMEYLAAEGTDLSEYMIEALKDKSASSDCSLTTSWSCAIAIYNFMKGLKGCKLDVNCWESELTFAANSDAESSCKPCICKVLFSSNSYAKKLRDLLGSAIVPKIEKWADCSQ